MSYVCELQFGASRVGTRQRAAEGQRKALEAQHGLGETSTPEPCLHVGIREPCRAGGCGLRPSRGSLENWLSWGSAFGSTPGYATFAASRLAFGADSRTMKFGRLHLRIAFSAQPVNCQPRPTVCASKRGVLCAACQFDRPSLRIGICRGITQSVRFGEPDLRPCEALQ